MGADTFGDPRVIFGRVAAAEMRIVLGTDRGLGARIVEKMLGWMDLFYDRGTAV